MLGKSIMTVPPESAPKAPRPEAIAFRLKVEEPAPEGRLRTYDAKSGGVIELLKSLKADFEKQKVESTKEETNGRSGKFQKLSCCTEGSTSSPSCQLRDNFQKQNRE